MFVCVCICVCICVSAYVFPHRSTDCDHIYGDIHGVIGSWLGYTVRAACSRNRFVAGIGASGCISVQNVTSHSQVGTQCSCTKKYETTSN